MITCKTALAANRVLIDQRTNTVSVVDICEGFQSLSFPFLVSEVTFLYLLERQENDPDLVQLQLRLSVDDTELFSSAAEADFKGSYGQRSVYTIQALAFPRAGMFHAQLLKEGTPLATIEFPVRQLDLPAPTITNDSAPALPGHKAKDA